MTPPHTQSIHYRWQHGVLVSSNGSHVRYAQIWRDLLCGNWSLVLKMGTTSFHLPEMQWVLNAEMYICKVFVPVPGTQQVFSVWWLVLLLLWDSFKFSLRVLLCSIFLIPVFHSLHMHFQLFKTHITPTSSKEFSTEPEVNLCTSMVGYEFVGERRDHIPSTHHVNRASFMPQFPYLSRGGIISAPTSSKVC